MGVSVSALPEKLKELFDQQISEFWNAFMATGVEAKVISKASAESQAATVPEPSMTTPQRICNCDTCILIKNIRILNHNNNDTITKDSIPASIDILKVISAESISDCPPECEPVNTSVIKIILRYNCIPARQTQQQWVSGP